MKTEHYLLTRFNLRLWSKDKNRNQTHTEKWLEDRFNLFEKFCFPSIVNQSNQNFKWIVLFDENTPASYKKRIEQYQSAYCRFCPCFVPPQESRYFLAVFKREVAQRMEKDTKVLITTYLDNDDALHHRYVEEVQQIKVEMPTFVSYVYGLQYYTQMNIATRVPFKNNHFLTLIEPIRENKPFRTVHGYGSHIDVERFTGVKTIFVNNPGQDRWIEVIHQANMDNDVKMTLDTHLIKDFMVLQKNYGIQLTLSKHSQRIFYTQFITRAFKEVIRHIRLRITGRKWN